MRVAAGGGTSLASLHGLLVEEEPSDEWAARPAAELTGLGLTARTGYPVGRWRVDLVVGERAAAVAVAVAVAVDTLPHPDGASRTRPGREPAPDAARSRS